MNIESKTYYPKLKDIQNAAITLKEVVAVTPLFLNHTYSKEYNANVLLKREDLQQVRSYKIRGAYNKINSLSKQELSNGIVCASAGNHAQGVALACVRKKFMEQYLCQYLRQNKRLNRLKCLEVNL